MNYGVVIAREVLAKREAAENERKRLHDVAEAGRKRGRDAAELKRVEAPLVPITEQQARAFLNDSAARSQNNVDVVDKSFISAVRKVAPDFQGPLSIISSEPLDILISGPLGYYFALAREKVRKFEPLNPPPTWPNGIRIVISPKQIDSADIEKVIVQRNGITIAPSATSLLLKEIVTRMGAKRMIHGGEIVYSLSAFDPGPGVNRDGHRDSRVGRKYRPED